MNGKFTVRQLLLAESMQLLTAADSIEAVLSNMSVTATLTTRESDNSGLWARTWLDIR